MNDPWVKLASSALVLVCIVGAIGLALTGQRTTQQVNTSAHNGGLWPISDQRVYQVIAYCNENDNGSPEPPPDNENDNDNGSPEPPTFECREEDPPELDFYETDDSMKDDPNRHQNGLLTMDCGVPDRNVELHATVYDFDTEGEALVSINGAPEVELRITRDECDKIDCDIVPIPFVSQGQDRFAFRLELCPDSWPHCPDTYHRGYAVTAVDIKPRAATRKAMRAQRVSSDAPPIPEGWEPVACVALRFRAAADDTMILGQCWTGADGKCKVNLPKFVDDIEVDIVGVVSDLPSCEFQALPQEVISELHAWQHAGEIKCSFCAQRHSTAWCPNCNGNSNEAFTGECKE